jgi:hypothetical protein
MLYLYSFDECSIGNHIEALIKDRQLEYERVSLNNAENQKFFYSNGYTNAPTLFDHKMNFLFDGASPFSGEEDSVLDYISLLELLDELQ